MKKSLAIVVACCAAVLALGLVACGGSSSGSAATAGSASGASTSASASTGSGSAATDATGDYKSAGYLDEFGIITAKALTELDGAELTKVADAASYKWEDKHGEWTKVGTNVAPSKGLTSEQMSASDGVEAFYFTPDEIAGLAQGGKGTPICWSVTSKAKVDGLEQVFANQQVTVVDQCEVEHRSYGKEIWAIIKNSAGDEFLLCAKYYSETSAVEVYNADYLATSARGVASSFNMGDYLLEDAHTIEAAFEVIKSGQVS